ITTLLQTKPCRRARWRKYSSRCDFPAPKSPAMTSPGVCLPAARSSPAASRRCQKGASTPGWALPRRRTASRPGTPDRRASIARRAARRPAAPSPRPSTTAPPPVAPLTPLTARSPRQGRRRGGSEAHQGRAGIGPVPVTHLVGDAQVEGLVALQAAPVVEEELGTGEDGGE